MPWPECPFLHRQSQQHRIGVQQYASCFKSKIKDTKDIFTYMRPRSHTLEDLCFEAEIDLYQKSSALVSYLGNEWTCGAPDIFRNRAANILPCLVQFYVDMYSYGILDKEDVEIARAWIED